MERLETVPRMTGVEEGLAARVHDPLWLLARQFQFGEFTAENAASVAWVDVEAEYHRLDRLRTTGGELEMTFDVATEPLERLVEQELPLRIDVELRTDGGVRWAQQLNAAGLGGLLASFTAPCPVGLRSAARQPRLPGAQPGSGRRCPRRHARRAGRSGHGRADRHRARPADQVAGRRHPTGHRMARLVAGPGTGGCTRSTRRWPPDHLGRAPDGARVRAELLDPAASELTANGYTGGRLDWWAVDAVQFAPSPQDPGGPPTAVAIRGVPAPARFGGMPVPRFWEMEDARFDPGAIDASPNDLGRLLLITFATVYGNDWFVLPLRLPVGTMSRITSFTVTDVFGGTRILLGQRCRRRRTGTCSV